MSGQKPRISIVTPSYNMLEYLKLCCASVADQNVSYEHVVMDGGSGDGTAQWLRENPSVLSVSEKDKGMYNALNKAIDKASADIIGHLNCDEQYLPGVLNSVIAFFDANPHIDFIAGDFLIVDPQGELLAYRKSFHPRWPYFFSNYLYTNTCTLFYRRKIFDVCRFDESYKSIADVIFLYSVIRKGFKGAHIRQYTAVFTYSGSNLSLDPISGVEKKKFGAQLPAWYKALKPLFYAFFFLERILQGTYWEKSPLVYAVYVAQNLRERVRKTKANPTFRLKFKRIE
jgi:glycosyltransferase involved in cell wall biosynthesis